MIRVRVYSGEDRGAAKKRVLVEDTESLLEMFTLTKAGAAELARLLEAVPTASMLLGQRGRPAAYVFLGEDAKVVIETPP